WRHLLVYLGTVMAVEVAAYLLSIFVASPRPVGILIVGGWEGFSFPSIPVAALAVTLVGAAYSLLPQGRARSRAKWAVGTALVVVGMARMYLAVDHLTDWIAAVILGVGISVVASRFFTPNDVYPVTYRRARAAH